MSALSRSLLLAGGVVLTLCLAVSPAGAQTDVDGYIISDSWLALGPFVNDFACSDIEGDIATLHVLPSLIQCQYPSEGDPVPYDPALSSTDGLFAQAPVDGSGNPIWYVFDDGEIPADGDLDMNLAGTILTGDALFDITDVNLYVATYVEYSGAAPIDIQICAHSDDGVQVWWDDQLAINDNACRGRPIPPPIVGCASTSANITVTPGCHRLLMGVWEEGGGFGGSLRLLEASTGLPITDADPDFTYNGTDPCGGGEPCVELAVRTVGDFSCPPAAPIQVTIQQPVPGGANANEVITVIERVTGEVGPADVTASNGGAISNLSLPPDSIGQFGDHRNVIVNPVCDPADPEANGDTVEGPAGTYTQTIVGEDIWTNGDTFQFAYNRIQGDFDVSIHVEDRIPAAGSRWGKHGIMARQSLDPRSRYSWSHDQIGDITTAAHNNDESTRFASRPTHLGADNEEFSPWPSNPSGDGIDDYCDGDGPDDGACTVVHHDYLRLERIGSVFTGYSRADPADPWDLLDSEDWGATAPAEVLVGLASSSHTTDCASLQQIIFDGVDYGGATILPVLTPALGVQIEWSVTRQQLAAGISYTVDIQQGTLTFDGTADGDPISGIASSVEVCLPKTGADGTFLPEAFLAYGPFGDDNVDLPCGGNNSELLRNFIPPENILCFAPAEGEEFEWDPVEAAVPVYYGPLGPGGDPIARQYGGTIPDLNSEFGGDDRMVWLITYIEYTGGAPFDGEFCFNSDDGGLLVYDGEFLRVNNVCRGAGGDCDQELVPVTIEPGMHRIAMAAFNRGGGWGIRLKLRDLAGSFVLDGDPDWVFHGSDKPAAFPELDCPACEPEPVTDLTCEFGPVGLGTGLLMSWTNPPNIDPNVPTRIVIGGVEVAQVATDATSATIPGNQLPAGFFSVQVIHCGGVPAICSPFCTDDQGYILTGCFLALGPISNLYGCSTNPDDILGNHIAPSFIGCEYPEEGEETQDFVDFTDPENVAIDWHPAVAPPVVGDPGVWRKFQDADSGDGDQDMETDAAAPGLDDHMTWLATYVEYTGPGGNFQLCASSDDQLVIWKNDELLWTNNACRGRPLPPAGCQDIAPFTLDGPEVIRFAAAAWDRASGWGLYFSIQDEFGIPVLDGDDDWIFHGTDRPGDVDDFPCTEPQPTIPDISCQKNGQGGVDVAWTLPPDLTASIEVSVNGVLVDTVSSTTTTYEVTAGQIGAGDFVQVCVEPQGSFQSTCCGIFLGDELYINSGGAEFTDLLGRVWLEDTLQFPSPFLTSPNTNNDVAQALPTDMTSDQNIVDNQFPGEIFQNERWSDGPVEYTISGFDSAKTYDIHLLFKEHCCSDGCLDLAPLPVDPCDAVSSDELIPFLDPLANSGGGCRIFNIWVNDAIVRENFSKSLLGACLAGLAPGAPSYGVAVSVVIEDVAPVDGTLKILLEDLGAGINPPENASIKGVCIVEAGECVPNPAGEICNNSQDDDCDGLEDCDDDDCDAAANCVGGGGFIRADVNADRGINITDAIYLLASLFLGGPPPPCFDAADTNDDGAVNITDAIYLLASLFLGGPPPPPPTGAPPGDCGPDPSADGLDCANFPPCP